MGRAFCGMRAVSVLRAVLARKGKRNGSREEVDKRAILGNKGNSCNWQHLVVTAQALQTCKKKV